MFTAKKGFTEAVGNHNVTEKRVQKAALVRTDKQMEKKCGMVKFWIKRLQPIQIQILSMIDDTDISYSVSVKINIYSNVLFFCQ